MDTAAPQWPQGIGVVKSVEKKARPGKDQALNCPRCSSTNTKFCYYNNYSLSQPRYFCKACRRYWTAGGCLRNVPVGGGSRKSRRPPSSSSSNEKPIVPISHGGRDLNHGSSNGNSMGMSEYISLPFDPQNPNFPNHPLPVMEFFKPANLSGFPAMHDFKVGLGFPAEGYYGNLQDDRANNKSNTDVFPFGEMKLQADQQIEQADQANGFWNGMSSSW